MKIKYEEGHYRFGNVYYSIILTPYRNYKIERVAAYTLGASGIPGLMRLT